MTSTETAPAGAAGGTVENRVQHYIDGRWVEPLGGDEIEVVDPTTEQVVALVPGGVRADADAAVAAASAAFEAWSTTSREERARLLEALRVGLEKRQQELSEAITRDVGTPTRIASRVQAALPLTDLQTFVDLLAEEPAEERVGNTLVEREAAGVVAAITPWNYPLHQITAKIAPALAAGCTVVVKPSEVAPLAAYLLFDAIDEAGFPPGVVNLVCGRGADVAEPLTTHPDVDVVSFTGSLAVGSQVMANAAASIKRVTLELGGKSANVVLDDADVTAAVKVGVANAFLNAGQTCTAWTRMLVPRERHDEIVALVKEAAEKYAPGDPSDPATKLGPVVSEAQRERVRGFIRSGVESGATLVTGGVEAPEGLDRGWFVRPTVFADVDPTSQIAQEEIFGPVLSVIAYDDEDDALAIANGTQYGLHGAVWSGDPERALAFARRVRTGQIDVNGAAYNPHAPFGGYRRSGVGREMGRHALAEFTEVKSIQV